MVRVKVCGITSLKDGRSAIACGCQAVGFVFYKKSSRYISPAKACLIIKRLPRKIIKVGVFVNSSQREARDIARLCKLDMLQLHGRQSPGFCRGLRDFKVIKAFRIKKSPELKEIKKYNSFAYLFDTYSAKGYGGTGRTFEWKLLQGLRRLKKPVFLAGGLSQENIGEAIKIVRPDWVDVSSSVEKSPGKKDRRKIKSFIEAVKRAALYK